MLSIPSGRRDPLVSYRSDSFRCRWVIALFSFLQNTDSVYAYRYSSFLLPGSKSHATPSLEVMPAGFHEEQRKSPRALIFTPFFIRKKEQRFITCRICVAGMKQVSRGTDTERPRSDTETRETLINARNWTRAPHHGMCPKRSNSINFL